MPEGPEIRRAADRIERAIGGREATRVFFAFPHLKKYQRRLSGKRVTAVETRGKAMLIRFSNGLVVYTHSQLYGRWYVRPSGSLPTTKRSLRLAIENGDESALLYSASEIEVLAASELDSHSFLSKLGPDVLDASLTNAKLARRLSSRRFWRRQLGALLLDQAFVAGVGNYLRSEILFVAGIHPGRCARNLAPEELRKLAAAIRQVSRRAYRTGGITNDAKRVAALRARGLRRSEFRHHVFGREGRRCWTCRSPVRRAELGGRRVYLCPTCQPEQEQEHR